MLLKKIQRKNTTIISLFKPLYILGNNVHLKINYISGFYATQSGMLSSITHQRNRKGKIVTVNNSKANTINSDKSLIHHIRHQMSRRRNSGNNSFLFRLQSQDFA